jgi:hypothetical protein
VSNQSADPERWAWPMPNSPSRGLPNERSYDLSSDEVVVDLVTGLAWQRRVDERDYHSWAEAEQVCSALELGGYDDWRLPTRLELVSLLALDFLDPSIDGNAFPDTPSDWFWTSTESADSDTDAWTVYFYFGYPGVEAKDSPFSVRCVRAEPGTAAGPRFEATSDEVVDDATGLAWQRQVPDEVFTAPDAARHCETADPAGSWRLPTMKELQTIVDPGQTSPAVDPDLFPDTPPESFWSATGWVEAPDLRSWHVDFALGNAQYLLGTTPFHVRCVKSAEPR